MTDQPAAAALYEAGSADDLIADYRPVATVPRSDGWTVARQKLFLTALTETGCVSDAARIADISPRSAYRLRARPEGKAFAGAWDAALHLASHRLVSLAWERAVYGATEEVWQDGRIVAQRRKPSEKLLMFLLAHSDPLGFGNEAAKERDWRKDASRWYRHNAGKLTDQPGPLRLTEWDQPHIPAPDQDDT